MLDVQDIVRLSRNANKRLNYEQRTRVLMQDLENYNHVKNYMKDDFPVPVDDDEEMVQSKEVSEDPTVLSMSDEIGQEDQIQKAKGDDQDKFNTPAISHVPPMASVKEDKAEDSQEERKNDVLSKGPFDSISNKS